jgi:DNA-binding LacI/PurR family transcriptional regulator
MNSMKMTYNSKAIRVSDQILEDIHDGRYSPGRSLPAEEHLAQTYQVSRPTVRRAIDLLTEKQHLVRLPQRGVVISDRLQFKRATVQIAYITHALTTETNLHVKGLTKSIDPEKYTLATYCTQENLNQFEMIVEKIISTRPAGVVLQTVSEELKRINGRLFTLAKIPVVTIGQHIVPGLECDRIAISGKDNGTKLAKFIIKNKFSKIAYISTTPRADAEDVLIPLRRELALAGIPIPEEKVFIFDAPHGYTDPPDPFIDSQLTMARLINEGLKCELLICGHDYIAVGCLRALLAVGIRVPRDIKVISGLRVPVEGMAPLKLTGFDFNHIQQGRLAADLLIRRIEGYTGAIEVHYCSADLVQGETA